MPAETHVHRGPIGPDEVLAHRPRAARGDPRDRRRPITLDASFADDLDADASRSSSWSRRSRTSSASARSASRSTTRTSSTRAPCATRSTASSLGSGASCGREPVAVMQPEAAAALESRLGLDASATAALLDAALAHRSWCAEHGRPRRTSGSSSSATRCSASSSPTTCSSYPAAARRAALRGARRRRQRRGARRGRRRDRARRLPAARQGRGRGRRPRRSSRSSPTRSRRSSPPCTSTAGSTPRARRRAAPARRAHRRSGRRSGWRRLQDAPPGARGAALDRCPRYLVRDEGPDHAKRFFATCCSAASRDGDGEGGSKKQAEQAAARAAWRWLRETRDAERDEQSHDGARDGGSGDAGAT